MTPERYVDVHRQLAAIAKAVLELPLAEFLEAGLGPVLDPKLYRKLVADVTRARSLALAGHAFQVAVRGLLMEDAERIATSVRPTRPGGGA